MTLAGLSLEVYGDDVNQRLRDWGLGWNWNKSPWVARIVGTDSRFGLAREFLPSRKDYSLANSVGSRGVYRHYVLSPGPYEVYAWVSWHRRDRYFLLVEEDGSKRRVTREEVDEWLSARSASMS